MRQGGSRAFAHSTNDGSFKSVSAWSGVFERLRRVQVWLALGASKTVTRKVAQEDAWDELRGDVQLLTEVARAQHALIVDLIDRVAELEGRAGTDPGASRGA